jgi:glutathione S-transferase
VRRLLTIPISHYCEKARWALDRAGLDYREERHVQGIHQVVARRAGGGRTVPVLLTDTGVIGESEEILRYADGHIAEDRRLFPADPRLRTEAEALSRWLDQGLGPDGRRMIYAQMLPHKDLIMRFNNAGVPRWEVRALKLLWPLAGWFIGRELGVGPDTVRDDRPRVMQAFDAVARRLADGRRFLCGERLTAADLTFACLAAPAVVPPEYGVRLPQPSELPADLAAGVREFREHPAGRFALELFRSERRSATGSAG